MPPSQPHVLIIGAGITGLLLAQAFRKQHVAYSLFERDPDLKARGRGWGLTINWSLESFLHLLPGELAARLPECYVNPEASLKGEDGNFLFFDLSSGEAKWRVPPSKRIRVSRERLVRLMLEGLDVQWSKVLDTVTPESDGTITASFADGARANGTFLVGADGVRSSVRASLISLANPARSGSHLSDNNALPFRLLGVTHVYGGSIAKQLRALDPFFFQGGDPKSDSFMYFSFLDTPSSYRMRREREHASTTTNGTANGTANGTTNGTATNGVLEEEAHECQIIISWPVRPGWRGHAEPVEAPEGDIPRIQFMKSVAEQWANPFREAILNLPEDGSAEVKMIKLEDWVPKQGMWSTCEGRATLVGDAAHTMTMYRGDGANNGIADVDALLKRILPLLQDWQSVSAKSSTPLKDEVAAYEAEMIHRGATAVLTSRKASVDAHDHKSITDQSPLVSRRVMVTPDQE